jgi:hypothetical protein
MTASPRWPSSIRPWPARSRARRRRRAPCRRSITSDLTAYPEGKACDGEGRCLPGYECSRPTNTCVPKSTLKDASAEGPRETGTAICKPGETSCAGRCVLLQSDPASCGGCGGRCKAPPGSKALCQAGKCASECDPGKQRCGRECTDTSTDLENCGACGTACPSSIGGAALCDKGSCKIACEAGRTDCGGKCVLLENDPASCGACGKACKPNEVCYASGCAVGKISLSAIAPEALRALAAALARVKLLGDD